MRVDEVADILLRISEVALVEARNADEFEAELFSAIVEAEEKLGHAKEHLHVLEDDWRDFLDEHPELTEPPSQKARLEFTDDELIAALLEALRQLDEHLKKWEREPRVWERGVCSHSVARVLSSDDVTHGDVIRVGQRLGKLAQAGRVSRIVEPYASLRYLVADDA